MLRWSVLFALATNRSLTGAVAILLVTPWIARAVDYFFVTLHLTQVNGLKFNLTMTFVAAILALLAAGAAQIFCPAEIKEYRSSDKFKRERLSLNQLESNSADRSVEIGFAIFDNFLEFHNVKLGLEKRDRVREQLRTIVVSRMEPVVRSEHLITLWNQLEHLNLAARLVVALASTGSYGISLFLFAHNAIVAFL